METVKVELQQYEARRLYREYRDARAPLTPIDREVKSAYREIAKGNVIIKALESIFAAGLNIRGLPNLCIARATAKHCWLEMNRNGTTHFMDKQSPSSREVNMRVSVPTSRFADTWAQTEWMRRAKAVMPTIPPRLRPSDSLLANFHVLWEAEWQPMPPVDPILLRRIGKADLWVVCAAWDLTEVERGALATRVMGNA